jgi:hypothetical protein
MGTDTVEEADPLTSDEQEILDALIAHPRKVAAAAALNISRQTLYTRLKDHPRIGLALAAHRRESLKDLASELESYGPAAAARLHTIAEDPLTPPQVAAATSKAILDAIQKNRSADAAERVEALEALLRERGVL